LWLEGNAVPASRPASSLHLVDESLRSMRRDAPDNVSRSRPRCGFYIDPAHRRDLLCWPCWRKIVQLIDGGAYARKHPQVTTPEQMLARMYGYVSPAQLIEIWRRRKPWTSVRE
jgi:hypothetical protein